MHQRYGRAEGCCRECSHLIHKLYQRQYTKCVLYGNSNCEATDWTQKWPACGMKNKQLPEKFTPIVRFVAMEAREKKPEPPIEGQERMEGL